MTNETCNNKFILVRKATGFNYSVEAGIYDRVKNFDHHPGSYTGVQPPSPCNNEEINFTLRGETIEITHMDADTLLGISRMLEYYHPDYRCNQFWGIYTSVFGDHKMDCEFHLSASKIEEIDLNGSKGVEKFNRNLLYMVGVGQVCRDIKFPRLTPDQESLDVSEYVEKLFADYGCEEFIKIGKETQEKAEQAYIDCRVAIGDLNNSPNNSTQEETLKGLWVVSDNSFDPSRPYEDGVKIVVVYRENYKSVSIYCDPDSIYEFGGKEVGGILFAGHSKACGSPRGQEFTLEDAQRVFDNI